MASTTRRRLPDRLAPAEAARLMGVCTRTLQNWEAAGFIEADRLPSGHRRYRTAQLLGLLRQWYGDAVADTMAARI